MSIVTASSRFYPRDARPYGTIHTGSSEETARRARPTSRTIRHRVVRTDGLLPSLVHTRDRQHSGNLDGLGKRDQRFLAGDLRRNSCAVADLPCSRRGAVPQRSSALDAAGTHGYWWSASSSVRRRATAPGPDLRLGPPVTRTWVRRDLRDAPQDRLGRGPELWCRVIGGRRRPPRRLIPS